MAQEEPDPRKLGFYSVDISVVDQTSRELLHKYGGIPEDEINSHVKSIVSGRNFSFERCLLMT